MQPGLETARTASATTAPGSPYRCHTHAGVEADVVARAARHDLDKDVYRPQVEGEACQSWARRHEKSSLANRSHRDRLRRAPRPPGAAAQAKTGGKDRKLAERVGRTGKPRLTSLFANTDDSMVRAARNTMFVSCGEMHAHRTGCSWVFTYSSTSVRQGETRCWCFADTQVTARRVHPT